MGKNLRKNRSLKGDRTPRGMGKIDRNLLLNFTSTRVLGVERVRGGTDLNFCPSSRRKRIRGSKRETPSELS